MLFPPIPANTRAQLIMPTRHPDRLRERNQPLKARERMQIASAGGGHVSVEVRTGEYQFSLPLNVVTFVGQ